MSSNLNDRIFRLIVEVILFLKHFDNSIEMKIIKNQLIRTVGLISTKNIYLTSAGKLFPF
jgi:hypothetical protein